jgi:hypothetical protein
MNEVAYTKVILSNFDNIRNGDVTFNLVKIRSMQMETQTWLRRDSEINLNHGLLPLCLK